MNIEKLESEIKKSTVRRSNGKKLKGRSVYIPLDVEVKLKILALANNQKISLFISNCLAEKINKSFEKLKEKEEK